MIRIITEQGQKLIYNRLFGLAYTLTDISKFQGNLKSGRDLKVCILVGLQPTEKIKKTLNLPIQVQKKIQENPCDSL